MKISKHLSGYAPVKLAATLASFGGIYLFTRLLGPDEYGRYALMFSVMAIIHLLSLTWVEAASFRFSGALKTPESLNNHFKTSIVLLGFSLIVAAVWVIGLLILTWDHPQYRAFVPYIALLLPLNTLVKIAMEAHRAQQHVRHYMLSASAKIILGFIVGVLLAWKTGLGAVAPIAGLVSSAIILAFFEGRWVLRNALPGQTNQATLKAWAVYGIPTSIALGLDLLLSSADRFLIAYFIDEAAVGSYAAGYGIADKTVLIIFSWAAMAFSPLLMEAYENQDKSELKRRCRSFAKLLIIMGFPVATGIALVASPLADAMIGAPLRENAKLIMPWIAFSGLLNGLAAFYFTESFHLTRNTNIKAILMFFPVVINIALNVLLIPIFGLMGAVYATFISYFIAIILLALWGRRFLSMPWPFKDMAFTLLACAGMYPVIFIRSGLGHWADLFLMAATGALIYCVLILAMNVAECRSWAKTIFAKRGA